MGAVDRMIKYLEYKGLTKYKFCKDTGFSNGFLDKNRNIGSDKCKIISDVYSDINIEWLITGSGPMLKAKKPPDTDESPPSGGHDSGMVVSYLEKKLEDKDKKIEELNREIGRLNTLVEQLKKDSNKANYATGTEELKHNT